MTSGRATSRATAARPDAAPRPDGEGGGPVHPVLRRLADLLAVAVRDHHGPVPGPLADHQLSPDARRQRGVRAGRFPRPEGAVAAEGLEGGRLRDGPHRQVAPRRRPRRGRPAEVRRLRLRPRPRHLGEPRARTRTSPPRDWIWSDNDQVQALGPDGVDGRPDPRLPRRTIRQALLREPLARRPAHALGAFGRRPNGRQGRPGDRPGQTRRSDSAG